MTGARSLSRSKWDGEREYIWAEEVYGEIRQSDISFMSRNIAENTGVPESMLQSVHKHLFMDVHDIPMGRSGRIVNQRFDADPVMADLWTRAINGPLDISDLKDFNGLIGHEFVESGLMKLGLPYRSSANAANNYLPAPNAYGAHDWAPKPFYIKSPWEHLPLLGK